jgi:hypothetical protein
VLNATFSNSSATSLSWRPVLVVEEAGVPERTTDIGKATGILYHLRLANVKHNNNNMDLKIRMIGVYIYQLQYFLMEIDVDKQQ